jgi:hypothetical protein
MTRQDYANLLMLLSALESWSFSVQAPIPDFLHDELTVKIDLLKKQILEG